MGDLTLLYAFLSFIGFAIVVSPLFIYAELRRLARLQVEANLYSRALLKHFVPGIKLPDDPPK